MNVKIKKLNQNAQIPMYQSLDSAAADLYACLDSSVTIMPGQRVKIPTGIAIEAERADIVAVICARSGLSAKHGIALANGIGVVDSDYRGEILVSMVNLSNTPYTVENGERVAQLMFLPVIKGVFEESETLSETTRGEGGFGSTGNK